MGAKRWGDLRSCGRYRCSLITSNGLGREGRANETHSYAILVSFRKYVSHERLCLEVGASSTGARVTPMRDVYNDSGRMREIARGEQGHSMLADIDRANPLVKPDSVHVGTLNSNQQL